MNNYDILTIGSATQDVFVRSQAFKIEKDQKVRTGTEICLILGTKLEVPEVVFTTGGGGTNTAVGFARQGLKVACLARIGNDLSGKSIQAEFKKEGIGDFLQIDDEHPTAYSLILVAPNGERTILEYRGANDYITEKDINWRNFKSNWLFLDSLAGNFKLLEKAMVWAREVGAKIAFNPGKRLIKDSQRLKKFIEGVDIFISNEDEASFITGLEPGNDRKIFKVLDEIVKGIVVMTRGPRGVLVSDGERVFKAGVPDSVVIDRTGAGDAFSSGFVAGYIQGGGDIEFAIQLGTANATSVVKYFGAKKGLLKKGDWGGYEKVKIEVFRSS